jgi:hypothetical protein
MPTDRTDYMKAYRADARKAGVRRVSATLNEAEYGQLAASAKRHGERITTHLKSQALANLDRRYLVPPDTNERLDTLIAIMRGIGNNLNQLARHSNEMRYFLDTGEVRLQIKRMEDAVRQFLAQPPAAEN